MKKSTKIIGFGILAVTGLSIFLIKRSQNKTSANGQSGYLDDVEDNTLFDPKAVAETLYESMRTTGKSLFESVGFSIGTQRDLIFETLSNISPKQFNSVVKAFGFKAYNKRFGNQKFVLLQKVTKYGLKNWLKEELPIKDYALLKNRYPKNL